MQDNKPRKPLNNLKYFLAKWKVTDAEVDYLKHLGFKDIENLLRKNHFSYDDFEGIWNKYMPGKK